MTKIVTKKLPHAIATSDVTDSVVRKKVMLLTENIKTLYDQLKEVQKAAIELQCGVVKVNLATLATDVAPLVEDIVMEESATAYQSAQAAANSAIAAAGSATTAISSATDAGTSATSSGTSATNAAESETNALAYKTAAETARDRAEVAAQSTLFVTTLGYCNVDLGYDNYTKFYMDAIVIDTSKTYDVKVTFNNTSSTTRTCSAISNDASEETSISVDGLGKGVITIQVAGSGWFKVDNYGSSIDVIIQIKEKIS